MSEKAFLKPNWGLYSLGNTALRGLKNKRVTMKKHSDTFI